MLHGHGHQHPEDQGDCLQSPVPVPFQWTVNGSCLRLCPNSSTFVSFSQLRKACPSLSGTSRATCVQPGLCSNANMGCLQCLSSVGLLFRLYMVCVPATASYGCEIWGPYMLQASAAAARQQLSQTHLHMLKEISGARQRTPISVLLTEFGLKSLPDLSGCRVQQASGILWLLYPLEKENPAYEHLRVDKTAACAHSALVLVADGAVYASMAAGLPLM